LEASPSPFVQHKCEELRVKGRQKLTRAPHILQMFLDPSGLKTSYDCGVTESTSGPLESLTTVEQRI